MRAGMPVEQLADVEFAYPTFTAIVGIAARRILRDGGHYLLAIWDRIERNRLSHLAYQAMEQIFPDNPPKFMTRGPFSYYEPEWIEAHL